MRRKVEKQSAPGAQTLYNRLKAFVDDLEEDVYTTDDLFVLLGEIRAFLEENHGAE